MLVPTRILAFALLLLAGCPRAAAVQQISPPTADCDPGGGDGAPAARVEIGALAYDATGDVMLTAYEPGVPAPLIPGFQGSFMLVSAVRFESDADLGETVCMRVRLRDTAMDLSDSRESNEPWLFERQADGAYWSRSFQFVLGEYAEELVGKTVRLEVEVTGAVTGAVDVAFPLGPPEG